MTMKAPVNVSPKKPQSTRSKNEDGELPHRLRPEQKFAWKQNEGKLK